MKKKRSGKEWYSLKKQHINNAICTCKQNLLILIIITGGRLKLLDFLKIIIMTTSGCLVRQNNDLKMFSITSVSFTSNEQTQQ